jgi:hypothetical protein
MRTFYLRLAAGRPTTLDDVMPGRHTHRGCDFLVTARVKADALDILREVGVSNPAPAEVRVAPVAYTPRAALTDAGLLPDGYNDTIVAYEQTTDGHVIAAWLDGRWATVAHWRYDRSTNRMRAVAVSPAAWRAAR